MAEKKIKDIPESVRGRLKNIAKRMNRDFDALLLQYFQERFLYRISLSDFCDNLILKGALLLYVKNIGVFRPTKDIDFLGRGIESDPGVIKKILIEIASIDYNDGFNIIPESIEAFTIKEGAEYEGVRVKVKGRLGSIRKTMVFDFGFGDHIIGGPEILEFPVLLDYPAPRIKCYTLESVIAEKFQAIVWLNYQTSRLKDFYDILFLAETGDFSSQKLRKAIVSTFKNRNTELKSKGTIFSKFFKNDPSKQVQWQAFLKKNRISKGSNFTDVIDEIKKFLEPLFNLDAESEYKWDRGTSQWIPQS